MVQGDRLRARWKKTSDSTSLNRRGLFLLSSRLVPMASNALIRQMRDLGTDRWPESSRSSIMSRTVFRWM